MTVVRDHGGGLDAAIARYGGSRASWLDLSTGINPVPYPLPQFAADAWTALPDKAAFARLHDLARGFWGVPAGAGIVAATGASAIIAALPRVFPQGEVCIPGPTYNEHEAAFRAAGWTIGKVPRQALVAVHPNNPDGAVWSAPDFTTPIAIIDESFCDVMPDQSLVHLASRPNTVILKSFGKFWGLAGLRLGFAIGDPAVIARLADILGPWQVSGPALNIGAEALADPQWADATRARLTQDAQRLDQCVTAKGAELLGGTSLFRLYRVDDAARWQDRLAQGHVWSRVFPYARDWLRLGFAIGDPVVIARLADLLGPWQVSGPALNIGAEALADPQWADATRARLTQDAQRLDQCVTAKGAELLGGTSLFRLYRVDDAARWQDRLAQSHIWSRVFPYARDWLRLGLPAPDRWAQLEAAL